MQRKIRLIVAGILVTGMVLGLGAELAKSSGLTAAKEITVAGAKPGPKPGGGDPGFKPRPQPGGGTRG